MECVLPADRGRCGRRVRSAPPLRRRHLLAWSHKGVAQVPPGLVVIQPPRARRRRRPLPRRCPRPGAARPLLSPPPHSPPPPPSSFSRGAASRREWPPRSRPGSAAGAGCPPRPFLLFLPPPPHPSPLRAPLPPAGRAPERRRRWGVSGARRRAGPSPRRRGHGRERQAEAGGEAPEAAAGDEQPPAQPQVLRLRPARPHLHRHDGGQLRVHLLLRHPVSAGGFRGGPSAGAGPAVAGWPPARLGLAAAPGRRWRGPSARRDVSPGAALRAPGRVGRQPARGCPGEAAGRLSGSRSLKVRPAGSGSVVRGGRAWPWLYPCWRGGVLLRAGSVSVLLRYWGRGSGGRTKPWARLKM